MTDVSVNTDLTRVLKNSWMEFLFSSFLAGLAVLSAAWEAAETALFSTAASEDLAAALGSSLTLTAWAASAAAAGAGVVFLGSAAWNSCDKLSDDSKPQWEN